MHAAVTAVLVEGVSDQLALAALAERRDRDLSAEAVSIIPMGGVTNIGHYLDILGPRGLDVAIAGLCDEGEVHIVQRGLARSGLAGRPSLEEMRSLGFFVCVADLEDELIRAVGVADVERVLEEHGDLTSYRTFQQMPAQRERPDDARLRRFMGTRSGRKALYAPLLVQAPAPFNDLLTHIACGSLRPWP